MEPHIVLSLCKPYRLPNPKSANLIFPSGVTSILGVYYIMSKFKKMEYYSNLPSDHDVQPIFCGKSQQQRRVV